MCFILFAALPCLALAGPNEFGLKFLENNKKRVDVVTLPSGLQYKVLHWGRGEHHPTADSECECHYEGRTAENWPQGAKFDSSADRDSPDSFITLTPKQVIKGWAEAMQLMVAGDKWEMYIPSELGYGDSGSSAPKIGAGEVLVFTVEVVAVKGDKKAARKCDVKTLKGCKHDEKEYVKKMYSRHHRDERFRLENMRGVHMTHDMRSSLEMRLKLLDELAKIPHKHRAVGSKENVGRSQENVGRSKALGRSKEL